MNHELHKSAQDARSGSTPHIVRYVLAISLTLAVITMLVLLLWGYIPR